MQRSLAVIVVILGALLALTGAASAEPVLRKSQTVYVPAYSHVFSGDRGYTFNLAVTLVVRSTEPKSPVTITAVEYYDDDGKLVRRLIEKPLVLKPLASTSFFIKESDTGGGIGANFIVRWHADREVNAPIIESVMIGARGGQGISFISPGREIRE